MKELNIDKVSAAGILIALGIVFGDLGTSPLYTYKAIIGDHKITETLILGSVSAIFWTLTFQTTIKYVFITMRADNNGEGGIFSLFALIRKQGKWLLWPAIIGGSFMIADSLITPPISVTSAIEGLRSIQQDIPILPITITILVILFVMQQSGTKKIGKYFGPTMVIWFSMIGVLGFIYLIKDVSVLRALNPYYIYELIRDGEAGGFWVLGAIFLCATGAEALYADMGHVGRRNIQFAWISIKVTLLLCYFGEAVLLQSHIGQTIKDIDPFFGMVPSWFLIPSIIISTFATIIASQALISGTFTQFNEAVRLNIWPKLRIVFPSELRGQVYIPSINWLMMGGCIFMVLYFKESSNMEAAFGLSVTLTMLMTTILLSNYLKFIKAPKWFIVLLFIVYIIIEGTFLTSNLKKFTHGGWITVLIGSVLVLIMYIWYTARIIKGNFKKNAELEKYKLVLIQLSNDLSIPKYATHLVYMTTANNSSLIEHRVIQSILFQTPKRADLYWFIHIETDDAPYTLSYSTEIVCPEDIVYVKLKLGFRIVPRVNMYFHKIVNDLVANKEIKIPDSYYSSNTDFKFGDNRFVVLKSFLSFENELSFWKNMLMRIYFILDKLSLPDAEAFGLDYNNVVFERVPLIMEQANKLTLIREAQKMPQEG